MFCKSGLLKSRINRGKILIVGNNNKTKTNNKSVDNIYSNCYVSFLGAFLIQKRKPNWQNESLLYATWDSVQLCKSYCKCNDLIKYRDGSLIYDPCNIWHDCLCDNSLRLLTVAYCYQEFHLRCDKGLKSASEVQ